MGIGTLTSVMLVQTVLYLVRWVDNKLIDDGYGCMYVVYIQYIMKHTNLIYIYILELWIERMYTIWKN